MLNRRDIFEIHRLKDKGLSTRKIAIKLNLDRGTVGRYIKHPEGNRKKTIQRPSKLDPYKEFIKEMVKEYPKVNAPVILKNILDKGFDGEITIVRKYLRTIKKKQTSFYSF